MINNCFKQKVAFILIQTQTPWTCLELNFKDKRAINYNKTKQKKLQVGCHWGLVKHILNKTKKKESKLKGIQNVSLNIQSNHWTTTSTRVQTQQINLFHKN